MFLTAEDVKIKKEVNDEDYGKFVLEPLPRGYAHTLGASIRRVLLSSIKGAAPTQVELDGIFHQFSSIKGIKEDVVELTLNLKKLRVKMYTNNPIILQIDAKGPKKLTAKDIECPSDAEIINKDLHIATLADSKSKLKATLVVEEGFGYVPAEDRKVSKVGVIVLDSIFTPVLSVGYKVEPTRVGQKTDLDKLIFEIKTDGSISPFDAFMESCKVLNSFFRRLSGGEESVKEDETPKASTSGSGPNYKPSDVSVEELHLPTRTINALKKSGIVTLEDLTKLSRDELSKIRNLGEKSIEEIAKLLEKEGFKK